MKFHSAQFQGYWLHRNQSGAYVVNLPCIHERLIQRKKFWVRDDIKLVFYQSRRNFSICEMEKMVMDEVICRIEEKHELDKIL